LNASERERLDKMVAQRRIDCRSFSKGPVTLLALDQQQASRSPRARGSASPRSARLAASVTAVSCGSASFSRQRRSYSGATTCA
jgi:hypothetical protein